MITRLVWRLWCGVFYNTNWKIMGLKPCTSHALISTWWCSFPERPRMAQWPRRWLQLREPGCSIAPSNWLTQRVRIFLKQGTSSTWFQETWDKYRLYRTARTLTPSRGMSLCWCLPDEHGGVQQAYDGRDVDAHQHFAIDVLQAEVAVLHLAVRCVIMED